MKSIRTFLVFLFIATVAFAADYEIYTERPNVLKLDPRATQKEEWRNLNWAQLEFLTELLGLYPKEHLYFLARDGEYLYDLGLVLTEKYPDLRKRLHLINVSRNNQNNVKLKQYLIQSGLTEEKIKKYGVVFVDSGYSGSIAKHIKTKYSSAAQDKMYVHLVESHDNNIPDSKVFKSRDAMSAGDYEEMARYFDRSDNFKEIRGKLVPTSPKGGDQPYQSDGTVDKKEAEKYMQSMASFGRTKAARDKFEERLRQWRYISELIYNNKYSLEDLMKAFNKIYKTWHSDVAQAMIEDALDYYNRYFDNKILPVELTFSGSKNKKVVEINYRDVFDNIQESDFKSYTERDFRDLTYLLKTAIEDGEIRQVAEMLEGFGENHFLSLLRRLQKSMGAQEFEKFFHRAVSSNSSSKSHNYNYSSSYAYNSSSSYSDIETEERWFKAYRALKLESVLIQKTLNKKLGEFDQETDKKAILACRKAIGM